MSPALLWVGLAAGALSASPLFRAEHPRSRQAREELARGQGGKALESYGALEKEVGPRPEIEIGRGAALLGEQRPADAASVFAGARSAPGPLGAKALLGLGRALAEQGDLDGAIGASREALARDPAEEDARHNLEVLLRRKTESQAQKKAPGGPPRAGEEGQGGGGSGPADDRGGGGAKATGAPGAGPRPEEARREESRSDAGGASPGTRLSREEARRLLDAMRSREQNLPPRSARPRSARRPDVEKDW